MMLGDSLLLIAILFGLYAAWNIGANDVSNAMGTSVGSKALTLRQAVVIAAIFEFFGAVFFGSHVSETLQRGLINPGFFSEHPQVLVNGMLSSLLACGIWLHLATYFGLPVSTTHAIVGAIIGFGAIIGGSGAIHWDQVMAVGASWILSPVMGALLSFVLFSMLRRHIFYSAHPLEATKQALPWLVASMVIVLSIVCLWNAILPLGNPAGKLGIILLVATIGGFLTHFFFRYLKLPLYASHHAESYDPQLIESLQKAKNHLLTAQTKANGELNYHLGDIAEKIESCNQKLATPALENRHSEFFWVERIFGSLQIVSACLMAFSHGANDVSNAIGPLAAIVSIIETGSTTSESAFPSWILVIGGIGIVIGLATWGWRVIETIGKKITELTPSRGFSAEFGTALTVLFATRLGLPVSTTHTLVGAVLGVGFAGGIGALNLRVMRDILLAWVITLPVAASLSVLCYFAIDALFKF